MTTTYTPTIGLEIHAELNTKSKMFCGCKNAPHESEPNANICPVCLAHPGTLPVANKAAVQSLLMVGNAIGATLADFTEFDRKNYFYPDIPKAYQISQYQFPFVTGGEINGIKITRIHLEEDTARSQHTADGAVVDFNRAGVPLMELVTEPDIHDAETAVAFARELQLLLRTLGVSEANMEKGEMRVEANISVSDSHNLGTLVEVKNLNSFKAVSDAIACEITRHIEVLESGGKIVRETRGWDENKGKTFSQRNKEKAEEYRYFPDPDLPKLKVSEITDFSISRLSEITNKLPTEKRDEYQNLGLTSDQVELIISHQDLDPFFAHVVSVASPGFDFKLAANYATSDVLTLLDKSSEILGAKAAQPFILLINELSKSTISSRVAKDLLPEVLFQYKNPTDLIEERGLGQISSADDLRPYVQSVLADNPDQVQEFRSGKESVLQFFVGQVMKETKGKANPELLQSLLKSELSE